MRNNMQLYVKINVKCRRAILKLPPFFVHSVAQKKCEKVPSHPALILQLSYGRLQYFANDHSSITKLHNHSSPICLTYSSQNLYLPALYSVGVRKCKTIDRFGYLDSVCKFQAISQISLKISGQSELQKPIHKPPDFIILYGRRSMGQ